MSVEATIIVEFNGGTENIEHLAVVELDDILNEEKTTFNPGDEPYIRAHFSNNVRLDAVVATDGGVVPEGASVRTIAHNNLFTSRDAEEPDVYRLPVVPNSSAVSYDGRTGDFTAAVLTGGIIEYTGDTARAPFLMQVSNDYGVVLHRLIPPALELEDEETYTIYVVYYVTVLEAAP